MLRIPSKVSVTLSLVLTVIFFVALICAAFILPGLVDVLCACARLPVLSPTLILVLAYLSLADAIVADALLLCLLLRVKAGMVFTAKSVALVRGVSWCCFFIGILFFVLGFFFIVYFVICFAAMLLGLCLRVVKNVIEEATEMKAENDLTV